MAIHVEIAGYDSLEQIGVGGMAAVYKARQLSIDKTVAIKVLFPYLASDESFIERFQREARAAARIQHENIVNVIDFGESEGSYYIVMEYYEGRTLEEILKSRNSIPVDIAVQILLEVCYGLESAHAQDIVHRDIKPGNLIFTNAGGIKIADFGLAKRSDSMTMITQHGKVIGTPAYMSPEQAAGRNVSTTSDVFSLGVVAYEMLCRSKPFEGNTYSEVLERIQTYEPPSVADLNPLIQPDIENVIARMLEKDEPHRYQSMTDVITDLEHAMEKLQIPRDRRRLSRYITDPDAYEASFRDKVVSRCLSQGAYYMQKGQSHLDEAMLEFKRILYVDPSNERARRNLERIRAERGEKEKTVTLETVAAPIPRRKRAAAAPKANAKRRPRRRAARGVFVFAAVLVAVASTGYVAVQRGLLPAPAFLPSPNEAPALSAPNRLTVTAGENVEFRLQAVDAEGDAIVMRAHSLPEGARLGDDGTFAWQPAYGQEGSHRITFQADDGNSAATAVTEIEVQPARLSIDFEPIDPVRMKGGQRMSRTLRAQSDSGDPVRYRLTAGPEGMVVEGDQLRWSAPDAMSGDFTATVVASDGHVEATRDVTVSVSPPRPSAVSRIGSVEWRLPEKADIYVDGALKKRATDRVKLDLPTGRHTLQAQLESGITGWNQVVDVKAGDTATLRAQALEYGALSVYFLGSVGEFQINGKTFSHQPPFSAVRVPVGDHPVSCRMAGDERPKEFNIRVEKGKETVIEYEVGREPSVSIEEG